MSKKSVLVIGAGGLGITCGYHLQLAGADIGFYVRPNRLEALSRPQKLYCYNDHTLKSFEGYQLYSSADELAGKQFDFVLLTLDGATCRSEEGTATLTALGKVLQGSNMVICGVGVGLYEHVQKCTGFAAENLLEGTMSSLAYQVSRATDMPLPPPTDVELHNSADFAFLNMPKGPGFMLASSPKKAAKELAQLFDQSGVISASVLPAKMFRMFTNSFFPSTMVSALKGWPGTEAVIADSEWWHLSCQSQREIMGLKQYGLAGKVFSRVMSDKRLAKMLRDTESQASAMGLSAFNRFHHGGKVVQQNIQIMENCMAIGEKEGRDMTATKTLLNRWREFHQS